MLSEQDRADGWTDEAVEAFQARDIAIDQLQKAERALAVALATYRQAQRDYERAVDTMVANRAAQAQRAAQDEGGKS